VDLAVTVLQVMFSLGDALSVSWLKGWWGFGLLEPVAHPS
jgi:hypothetical protein